MLLLWAVVIGLILGGARAIYNQRPLAAPDLSVIWLAPLAFVPQWLAFFWPPTRVLSTDSMAIAALVGSQVLLLVFVWYNRAQPGFWLMGLGLVMNLTVIVLNGGLMPISPETVMHIAPPGTPVDALFPPGTRLGTTKDIVLETEHTRLWWFSDVLLFPTWVPLRRFAYSVGDVLIAAGVIWLLWQSGSSQQTA